MKISLNWLKNYIDTDKSPEELSVILTDIGLEVEGIEIVEEVKGGLSGLVIGQVTTCIRHPNADKLSLTTVDVGGEELLQIVCGAPNVDVNQKVVVATVGTPLYDQDGNEFIIKKGKIRGEVSEGMICAEDEIGLGSSHDGILVLDESAIIGTPASEFFNIKSDVVFDINLTPNRSDATSHLGVARDLAAYLTINENVSFNVREPEVSDFHVDQRTHPIKIEVLDKVACPRYAGVTIHDVTIGESPSWLKSHLISIGVRPINNIVDTTNFVLHEMGQPLHAFDYDKISKHEIRVEKLAEGSGFTSLDEKERKLLANDLMICDGDDSPLCMAGVFGGHSSGVSDNTKTIFLESAHFDPIHVRNTSMKHVLRTDAAKIFEKGSDPAIVVLALKRAANLIKEIAGGVISSDIEDIYPVEIKPKELHLRYNMVNSILGVTLSKDDIHNILLALDMEIQPVDTDGIKVIVPTNKNDVTREIDLIEEILRIYGFNKVFGDQKIQHSLVHGKKPDKRQVSHLISTFLSSQGYNEMMNLSLVEGNYYPNEQDTVVKINNTSNIHLDSMRPEMMVSGLQSVVHNLNRQQSNLKLFEFGKSYQKQEHDFLETEYLTLFLCGNEREENWIDGKSQKVSFYNLKSQVNNILHRIGISNFRIQDVEDFRFDYGLLYSLGQLELVKFGKTATHIDQQVGIKSSVFYAEFPIKNLLTVSSRNQLSVSEISKYPTVERDLAIILDESVKFDEVEKLAKSIDKQLIKEVSLFDIYRNDEQIGKNKKSYAINIKFEDKEKTLNDKEVDKKMSKMISTFENKLEASIRK